VEPDASAGSIRKCGGISFGPQASSTSAIMRFLELAIQPADEPWTFEDETGVELHARAPEVQELADLIRTRDAPDADDRHAAAHGRDDSRDALARERPEGRAGEAAFLVRTTRRTGARQGRVRRDDSLRTGLEDPSTASRALRARGRARA
jgi:hypothetical protein